MNGKDHGSVEVQKKNFSPIGLENEEFRKAAHNLVDIIIDYYESLQSEKRLVLPNVKPGFMSKRVNRQPPEEKEDWKEVFKDIEQVVFDGAMHWQSPNNLAYYAAAFSYPALLGEMLSNAVSTIGFTWSSGPSCTELETIMMDWLAKALNLPQCFIHDGKGPGGGVIQGTACEATVMTLLSARTKYIELEKLSNPAAKTYDIASRLVAYASKCSHSSVERAGKIGLIEFRLLDYDENISLRGETLKKAIEEDKKNGRIPFYVCATLGTTSCCTYDNLEEIGPICLKENIWLHVDAAYAGSALLCSELRYIGNGLEYVTSFNFNPHKSMAVNFDCSALWVRSTEDISNSLKMNPVFLQHENQEISIDYMHWQLPLGRKFRSIKLWFVLRMIGLEGLRHKVRLDVAKAKYFENLVRSDERFEVLFPVTLGLVCFRLAPPNKTKEELNNLNKELRRMILEEREFNITQSEVNDGLYFLRVSTGVQLCTEKNLFKAWTSLQEKATNLLKQN